MHLLLVLFSAVLLPLALPNEVFPWGLALPGLVALVPLFLAVYRSETWKQAARLGALFGAVSTAIGNYWLAFFGEFSVWTIGGAVVGYTGYNYILFGYLFYFSRKTERSWYRPLQIALVWTAYEYLKSTGFLGYPWGLIAYPLAVWNPLAQGAELAGVWGLSFLGAWINAALAEMLAGRDRGVPLRYFAGRDRGSPVLNVSLTGPTGAAPFHIGAAMLVMLVVSAFGLFQLNRLDSPEESRSAEDAGYLNVLVVQQNIDSWDPGRFADALSTAQRLTLETLWEHEASGGPPVDFVLWSETSLRRPYSGPDDFYRSVPEDLPFTDFLALLDLPLVTGVPMPFKPGERDLTNSAVVIAPDGTLLGQYAKQQLVPFAELIPFWELATVRDFFRDIVGVYGSWVPGRSSTVVPVPLMHERIGDDAVPVGLPICFEDGFGWVPREMVNNGARILLNLTNNSWSRQDSAQTQHYVAARLRAIELRTTLVRGTNSGLSGVVDQRGVLTDELPMFESTAAVMRVPVTEQQWTLYRLIGDLPGLLAVVFVLLTVVFRERRYIQAAITKNPRR